MSTKLTLSLLRDGWVPQVNQKFFSTSSKTPLTQLGHTTQNWPAACCGRAVYPILIKSFFSPLANIHNPLDLKHIQPYECIIKPLLLLIFYLFFQLSFFFYFFTFYLLPICYISPFVSLILTLSFLSQVLYNFIHNVSVSTYSSRHRGGKGVKGD